MNHHLRVRTEDGLLGLRGCHEDGRMGYSEGCSKDIFVAAFTALMVQAQIFTLIIKWKVFPQCI